MSVCIDIDLPVLSPSVDPRVGEAVCTSPILESSTPQWCIVCLGTDGVETRKSTAACGCDISAHEKCAAEWYRKSTSCPLCRVAVRVDKRVTSHRSYWYSTSRETDFPCACPPGFWCFVVIICTIVWCVTVMLLTYNGTMCCAT
jgi:hypothetical protein